MDRVRPTTPGLRERARESDRGGPDQHVADEEATFPLYTPRMLIRTMALVALLILAASSNGQPKNGNRVPIETIDVTAVPAEPPSPPRITSEPQRAMKFADGVVACLTTYGGTLPKSSEQKYSVLWVHKNGKTTIAVPSAPSGSIQLNGVLKDGMAVKATARVSLSKRWRKTSRPRRLR